MSSAPEVEAPAAAAAASTEAEKKAEHVFVFSSPYPHLQSKFNDHSPSSFFDVQMEIPGSDEDLCLHRLLLSNASKVLLNILLCKEQTHGNYDTSKNKLKWFLPSDRQRVAAEPASSRSSGAKPVAKKESGPKADGKKRNGPKADDKKENGDEPLLSTILTDEEEKEEEKEEKKVVPSAAESENSVEVIDWQTESEETAVYCRVVIKWLRFCYGEDVAFAPEECGAAVAVLFQLQLTCIEDVIPELEKHMISVAGEDIDDGVKILLSCAKYYECNNKGTSEVAVAVAKKVLTLEKIKKNEKKLLDDCLFHLPLCYLSYVEYDEGHGPYSELSIRCRYLGAQEALKEQQKTSVMKSCDFSRLNCTEMEKVCELGVLDKDDLLKAYQKALKGFEKRVLVLEMPDKMTGTSSETSTIPTDDQTTENGGAVYDPVHKIILSVSGSFNNGRNVKLTDYSRGTTTVKPDLIPFNTIGHCPVFDGSNYTYFFQGGEDPNNRFGRLAMDTMTFEELTKLPSGSFKQFSRGCVHNGNVYLLNSENSICEYDPKTCAWKVLFLKLESNACLLNDPKNEACIYGMCEGRKFVLINLSTNAISDVCNPPVDFGLKANNEAYLMRTPYCDFFVFATFANQWYVYWSKKNSWSALPKWKPTAGSSSHFVVIEEGSVALYHINATPNWEIVHLPSDIFRE